MAVAATKASPPPCPALAHPDNAAAKALTYLCLASMWVGSTGLFALAFADLASRGGIYGVGFRVVRELLKVSTDAALFGVLLALVVILLLLRVALRLLGAGVRVHVNKISAESMRSMLRDIVVIGWLVSLSFATLGMVGCLVMIGLSPAKGSLTARIGTVVIDMAVVASMALSCFVTIPSLAIKLWRMSPGVKGDAPADSIV